MISEFCKRRPQLEVAKVLDGDVRPMNGSKGRKWCDTGQREPEILLLQSVDAHTELLKRQSRKTPSWLHFVRSGNDIDGQTLPSRLRVSYAAVIVKHNSEK